MLGHVTSDEGSHFRNGIARARKKKEKKTRFIRINVFGYAYLSKIHDANLGHDQNNAQSPSRLSKHR